jgi:hypothetical protein
MRSSIVDDKRVGEDGAEGLADGGAKADEESGLLKPLGGMKSGVRGAWR